MNTISILIPTRNNNDKLRETMRSCFEQATHPERLEFIVRMDFDAQLVLIELGLLPQTRIIIGPVLKSWNHSSYECRKLAKGEICLELSDDIQISKGWDVELESGPEFQGRDVIADFAAGAKQKPE